jgi:hypothetical protein
MSFTKILLLAMALCVNLKAEWVAQTQAKVQVDGSGKLIGTGGGGSSGVSVTAITGAAATSYFDKLTNSANAGATAANQTTTFASLTTFAAAFSSMVTQGLNVSVTSNMSMRSLSNPAYTVLSSTVTTVNVTSACGTDGNYMIGLSANYGACSAIRYVVNFSATAPTDLATRGFLLASTATAQVLGDFQSGVHVHMLAQPNPTCSAGTGNDVSLFMYRRATNSLP